MGGFLEMANARLYPFWGDLDRGLRTGQPQNEIKHGGTSMFEELYREPERLEQFMDAMTGISAAQLRGVRREVRLLALPDAVRRRRRDRPAVDARRQPHPHMRCTSFDLPAVTPIAQREDRGRRARGPRVGAAGRFLRRSAAKADVITMGMILHDWNLEKKMHLIRAAYDALPPGGAFVAIENLIDDARRENAFGLLMSLNMLIEFGDAFDFTGADFSAGAAKRVFSKTEVIPLRGPTHSAAVATQVSQRLGPLALRTPVGPLSVSIGNPSYAIRFSVRSYVSKLCLLDNAALVFYSNELFLNEQINQ